MDNSVKQNKPVVLIILDGWGVSPFQEGNAISQAKTPYFDQLIFSYPTTLLQASGTEVGLDIGEMGNSEVGHLNLGTGRIIMQDLPRITNSIESNVFFDNENIRAACEYAKKNNSTLHLLGLASSGGVHSHVDHLLALLKLAQKEKTKKISIHMITDGRDTPPKMALVYLKQIEEKIAETKVNAQIATICGRYFGMDRDKHWERVQKYYELIINGKGEKFSSGKEAIESAYKKGESDENMSPTLIGDKPLLISKNDAVIFYNFRSDRAKQLTQSITNPSFNFFPRSSFIENLLFVTFTSYGQEATPLVKVAYFAPKITNQVAKVISDNKYRQLHIAETEKYAHVTYFFNGGIEEPYANEIRVLVPSPRVATYDLKPEMSAVEITNKFISNFKIKKPHFTVMNFANPDMVGHTGDLKSTLKAINLVDNCIGKILNSIPVGVANYIITADHGNAEQMINPQTGEIDKEHTTNPVPCILAFEENNSQAGKLDKDTLCTMQSTGVLVDISATILDLLGIEKPQEISGQSLKDIL